MTSEFLISYFLGKLQELHCHINTVVLKCFDKLYIFRKKKLNSTAKLIILCAVENCGPKRNH